MVSWPYVKDLGKDLGKAPQFGDKQAIYSDMCRWITVTLRAEYERTDPSISARIIDNLINPEAKLSVV